MRSGQARRAIESLQLATPLLPRRRTHADRLGPARRYRCGSALVRARHGCFRPRSKSRFAVSARSSLCDRDVAGVPHTRCCSLHRIQSDRCVLDVRGGATCVEPLWRTRSRKRCEFRQLGAAAASRSLRSRQLVAHSSAVALCSCECAALQARASRSTYQKRITSEAASLTVRWCHLAHVQFGCDVLVPTCCRACSVFAPP